VSSRWRGRAASWLLFAFQTPLLSTPAPRGSSRFKPSHVGEKAVAARGGPLASLRAPLRSPPRRGPYRDDRPRKAPLKSQALGAGRLLRWLVCRRSGFALLSDFPRPGWRRVGLRAARDNRESAKKTPLGGRASSAILALRARIVPPRGGRRADEETDDSGRRGRPVVEGSGESGGRISGGLGRATPSRRP